MKAPKPAKEHRVSVNSNRVWGKTARRSPRHANSVRRVLLISNRAWEGRSAGEIADELGVSVQYVYQLCSDFRISLIPKTKAQYAFRTVIELESLTRLETIAASLEDDVTNLVSRAINALSRETVLLTNLLEEDDPPPPKRGYKRRQALTVTNLAEHDKRQKPIPRKPATNTKIDEDDREDDDASL